MKNQIFTILTSNKKQLAVSVLTVLLLLLIFVFDKYKLFGGTANGYFLENWFAPLIDPVFGIATFVLASIIGFQNMKKEWINNLDKKLTVHYKIKDNGQWKYILTCYQVSLSDEGDIRSLSQQIGGQMTNNSRLKFELNFDEEPTKIIKEDGEWIQLYEACFYLLELPENDKAYQYKIWWWNKNDNEHKELKTDTLGTCKKSLSELRNR